MLRYRNIARIVPREPPTDTSLARAHALGFDAVVLTGGRPDDVGRAAVGGLGVLLDLPAGELEPWLEAGVVGFCCAAAHQRPPASWKRLITQVRGRYPETLFLAFTYGADARSGRRTRAMRLRRRGLLVLLVGFSRGVD